MATYTITATDVDSGAQVGETRFAGEPLVAGDFVYSDASDGSAKKADADALATATVIGMCLNSADTGQPVNVLRSGAVTVGSILTAAGKLLLLSSTAGKLMDAADISTGKFVSVVGWSTSATALQISILNTGLASP